MIEVSVRRLEGETLDLTALAARLRAGLATDCMYRCRPITHCKICGKEMCVD